MLQALIRNTKPEIIVSIGDEYLDHVGDEPMARYVNVTWQWTDTSGNWASLDVLGAIDDASDGNFDMGTLDYSFDGAECWFSDKAFTKVEGIDLRALMIEHACKFNPLHDGYIREDI